jgi:RNA polymerase sigma factor (sigma-70 family)
MKDSQELLADYARHGSEAAFGELVARYINLVYSAANRLVEGDAHRAEDVAQMVFVDLARMSGKLSSEVMLGGWLHRHTCFVAAKLMRGERRRQFRERQAVEMNALQNDPETTLPPAALDEAINELDEADRTAILLRFFEQRDFRSVGAALGSTEDAARMRVGRALEKLHSMLTKRGVTTSAAALGAVLAAETVKAAPAGLAAAISSSALLPAATTIKAIAMTTLQKTILTATVVAAIGAGIFEVRQASGLSAQFQALRQQEASGNEQLARLTTENSNLAGQLARASQTTPSDGEALRDLLRLRAEVRALRQKTNELAQLASGAQSAAGKSPALRSTNLISRESWTFAGYASPEAALQSLFWAKSTGNEKAWLDNMCDSNTVENLKNNEIKGDSDAERSQYIIDMTKNWLAYRILNEVPTDDDTAVVQMEVSALQNGKTNAGDFMMEMKRIGGSWKVFHEYDGD